MKHADQYFTNHREEFKPFKCGGFTSLNVLPDLIGVKWGDVALGFCHSVQPSCIRVIPEDGSVKCDACNRRLTVCVDADLIIREITQEVEVGIPDWFTEGRRNGSGMMEALKDLMHKPAETA